MTAIADQTRDELDQMLGIASSGTTQCGPARLADAQIHLWTRTNETKGEASRGAIVRAWCHISKAAATRGVTNQETIGLHIGALCCRMHMARSGESVANPRATTRAMVAGRPQSRSN
jgi:hypothetical protein